MKHTLLFALLLSTASTAQSPLPGGIDTAGMDPAVRAGDDFEAYANGGWATKAVIPPDRSSIGSFIALRDVSDERQKTMIADLGRLIRDDTRPVSHLPRPDEAPVLAPA